MFNHYKLTYFAKNNIRILGSFFVFTLFICLYYPSTGFAKELTNKKDGSKMALVPAGEFTMGSNKPYFNDEAPAHKVFLNAFYIDKYEITNAQYKQFVEQTDHAIPSHISDPEYDLWKKDGSFPAEIANQPVINIGWPDADAYCKWAGMRLPTEAEWEKAARGTDERLYPWGNQPPEEKKIPLSLSWQGTKTYKAVGTMPDNVSPYGVFDMAGNVSEWTADWYDEQYYKNSPAKNPTGPDTGFYKVVRGGASVNERFYFRAQDRDFDDVLNRPKEIGIRCVKNK